jgi:hypothetical protein
MGSVLKSDKINELSHSVGTIFLNNALMTIGARQYFTSSISVGLPSLSANSLYFIYAVLSGGVPQLVISQNPNSTGPIGFNVWKLVGAFRSDSGSSFDKIVDVLEAVNGLREDRALKDIGSPQLIATQASTNGNFTMTGTQYENGFISAYFLSQANDQGVSRFVGRVNGIEVTGAFSTGHGAAQYWNSARAGLVFPLKPGDTWDVIRLNTTGTQTLSCQVYFTPILK